MNNTKKPQISSASLDRRRSGRGFDALGRLARR